MASGHVTYGVRHGQDRQSEGQGYTDKPNTQGWKGGGQNRTATTSENQPERADKFGREPLAHLHGDPFLFLAGATLRW
jgi:hypothetical protein